MLFNKHKLKKKEQIMFIGGLKLSKKLMIMGLLKTNIIKLAGKRRTHE
jgi:hypothetical protein